MLSERSELEPAEAFGHRILTIGWHKPNHIVLGLEDAIVMDFYIESGRLYLRVYQSRDFDKKRNCDIIHD